MLTEKQYQDFDIYARALLNSNDSDPKFPFIKSTLKHFDFHKEWFSLVFSTLYNFESTMIVCKEMPSPDQYSDNKFLQMRNDGVIKHFGVERRGSNRNPINQIAILNSVRDKMKAVKKAARTLDQKGFRRFIGQEIPFSGDWATLKIVEIFENSLGYDNLVMLDLGIDGKDIQGKRGPIAGLKWLYGKDNVYDQSWKKIWNDFGKRLSNIYGFTVGRIETCLCVYNQLLNGKYFVGDEVAEYLDFKEHWGDKWEICMSENFPTELWKDIQHDTKQMRRAYKDKGIVLNAKFAEGVPSADIVDVILKTL